MRGYHCYITNHCLLNVFLVYLNQTNGCYEYVYVMLNAVIIIPAAIISPPHGVTHEALLLKKLNQPIAKVAVSNPCFVVFSDTFFWNTSQISKQF